MKCARVQYTESDKFMSIHDWMKFYREQGLGFIPVVRGTKEPPRGFKWSEFQKRKMTAAEIERWFPKNLKMANFNIAILGGSVSNNAVIVDVDDRKVFQKLFGVTGTFKYTTAHGGQAVFRSTYPIRNTNLRSIGLPIDIRGEGGYGVAPPSVHESGIEYAGTPQPILLITGDFMQELYRMIKQRLKRRFEVPKEKVDINTLMRGVTAGRRNTAGIRVATWFRRKGCSFEETIKQMEIWNEKNQPSLNNTELETITKSAYRPEEPYAYWFSKKKKETIFAPEILEKANSILEVGDPFQTIKQAAASLHAGDEKIIVIEWISALSSSLTNIKINTWQIGKSQKGKSHSKYTVLQLLPSEYYEVFTSASPVSLFYYIKEHGEWALDKKLLYLDEVEASSTALPMLRSLTGQTEILPRHLSVHDAKLLDLSIKGKRAVWFTSVQTFGTEQLKNRFIHLNPDESTEQDHRVFELQDKRYRLKAPMPKEDVLIAQAISKLIVEETKEVNVKIPFEIYWPFRQRRWLYPIFLAFIEVITKIRFKRRQRDETEALIATAEDFEFAKQLWKAFQKSIIYRVSKSALIVFELLPKNPETALTHAEISQKTHLSTRQIQRLCKELVEEGLVNARKRTSEGRGGRSSWEYWQAKAPDIDEMRIKQVLDKKTQK